MKNSTSFNLQESFNIVVENFRDPKCLHLVRPYVESLNTSQREELANLLEDKLEYAEAEAIFIMLDDLFD
jgi:catabolite regulation protein CreA